MSSTSSASLASDEQHTAVPSLSLSRRNGQQRQSPINGELRSASPISQRHRRSLSPIPVSRFHGELPVAERCSSHALSSLRSLPRDAATAYREPGGFPLFPAMQADGGNGRNGARQRHGLDRRLSPLGEQGRHDFLWLDATAAAMGGGVTGAFDGIPVRRPARSFFLPAEEEKRRKQGKSSVVVSVMMGGRGMCWRGECCRSVSPIAAGIRLLVSVDEEDGKGNEEAHAAAGAS
nr:hypothetical protein Iba_chr03fCG2260 [Ipomoea batatas]